MKKASLILLVLALCLIWTGAVWASWLSEGYKTAAKTMPARYGYEGYKKPGVIPQGFGYNVSKGKSDVGNGESIRRVKYNYNEKEVVLTPFRRDENENQIRRYQPIGDTLRRKEDTLRRKEDTARRKIMDSLDRMIKRWKPEKDENGLAPMPDSVKRLIGWWKKLWRPEDSPPIPIIPMSKNNQ